MDKREIKFKFKWADGKEWIVKDFTLDEIMNGEPFDYLSDSPFFRNYKMVERVQYTGLKDANGVEIYEGDIIYHDSIGIGFVEYRDNQAAYKIVFKGATRKWFVDMLDREYGLISVIGNIHENPELLK